LPEVLTQTDGERSASFLYGLGRLAAVDEGRYFVSDVGGSVRNDQRRYDAWGATKEKGSEFGFTGELHDGSLGLIYLRARWYDPSTGRLLGRDPLPGRLVAPLSQHPYLYAQANPTTLVDHSGLAAAWALKFVDAPFPAQTAPTPGAFDAPWYMKIGEPLSAVNQILDVMASVRVGEIDRLYGAAQAAFEEAASYYGKSAGLVDRALTPSERWFLRLPFVRDMRRGWFMRGADSAFDTAEGFFLKGSSLEDAAQAMEHATPGIRGVAKSLPWIGAAIDSGFAGWNQWQRDSAKNVPLDEKITNTATSGVLAAGGSYAGGALLAAGCSATGFGVILVAGCAAVGGYLGGKAAELVAPVVSEGVNWAREEVTQGVEWAGGAISDSAGAVAHGAEDAYDWGKEHLCPWC
jgi:RHS repeat-associated protein